MSDKNDKSLSETLFAFNNRIVDMKDVIKKAKNFQNTKIVRQIKLLAKKKGNDVQLEKNKRKCDHLKEEINHINQLKFNDVAIFTFDNDGVNFEQFIKTNNKNLTVDKIALARVALSKQVIKAVEDIKNDPKIQNWKHIFIAYKARCEKRRNWKEKNRLLKEIETKLQVENGEEVLDAESDEEKSENVQENIEKIETTNENKETVSTEISEKLKENKEIEPIKKVETSKETKEIKSVTKNSTEKEKKTEAKVEKVSIRDKDGKKSVERKVKFSDDESDEDDFGQDDGDLIDGYDSHEDDKWNEEVGSQEESSEEEEEDEEEEDEPIDLSQKFVFSKSNLQSKEEVKSEKILKPLIIGEKPSHMVIKQINLDDVKDCEELPIGEENTDKNEKILFETVKAVQDPFFLDQNGNEIYGSAPRAYKRSYDFEEEPQSYSSYDRYRKNRNDFSDRKYNMNRSSFKNSLSSDGDRKFGRPDRNFDRNDRNFDRRPERRDFQRDNFRDNKNGYGSRNDRNSFTSNKRPFEYKKDNAPKEDLSKLHPSWQAKKLAEEKAKSLKFEGKKVKFDDDDE